MDDVIKSYLESSEPFNRLFGKDGLVVLNQSQLNPKLIDFAVKYEEERGRPLDADDLRSIGAVFMNLADRLKEKNNG